jgi:hypothetical protein
MNENFSFQDLSAADRWLFAGNLATAVGLLCISVGSAIRLVSQGELPTGRPIFGQTAGDSVATSRDIQQSNKAKDYFS